MGGRGGSSGMQPVTYMQYQNELESYDGLGYGNGGATDQWLAGLQAGEQNAIRDYSGTMYKILNKRLRSGDPLSKTMASKDKKIHSAIEKFNLEKPTEFVRGAGTSLLGGADTVDKINAMVGQVIHDKGYMSTSASVNKGFGGKIKYHIHAPAGKGIGAYIVGLSNYPSENEFLFDKGSAFKITGAYSKPNSITVHVDLEYIGKS